MRADPYDRIASSLHWLIGLALIAQIVFGFLLDEIAPRGTPSRGAVINLHKSIGMVLGFLIVMRLLWRLAHRPPDWPAPMPRWQQRAARVNHAALYVGMLMLPLSGYVASNFSKHGVKFFGLALRPWGPDLPAVYNALNAVHVATSFVFTALVIVHVLAAFKHAFVDRDKILARIWPFSYRKTT